MSRTTTILALVAAAVVVGCAPPVAGRSAPDAPGDAAATDPVTERVWEGTRVWVDVGTVKNLKPDETALVKAAVNLKRRELRNCFEEPVRKRGCRTEGIRKAFDAMLMITEDGSVRDLRIVPGRQDLPRTCHDGVRCVAGLYEGMRIEGLERFVGLRQAYLTITLLTPDEEQLRAGADSGTAPP